MLRYTNFLFSVITKKKGLYICFILLCATFTIIFIPSINNANDKHNQGLFPITTFIAWFPFVFSSIFSSLLVIRIFKIGEEDGTELLILAKPLTRKEIIFSKFLVTYSMICAFHIVSFLFYFGIAHVDAYATASQRLKYTMSITIGGLIVSMIVVSIIVIISSFLEKVGTIVLGILFAAITPIYSFIIVPLSKATSPTAELSSDDNHGSPKYFLTTTQPSQDIYDPKGKGISFFYESQASDIKKNNKSWYRYAKYSDFWYQLGRFYSLFEPQTKRKSLFFYSIKHATYNELGEKLFNDILEETKKVSIKTFYIDSSNDKEKLILRQEFVGTFSKDEIDYDHKPTINGNKYIGLTKLNGSLPTSIERIQKQIRINENKIGYENIITAKKIQLRMQLIKDQLKIDFGIVDDMPFKYYRVLLWRAMHDYQTNNPLQVNSETINLDLRIFSFFYDSWIFDMYVNNNFDNQGQLAFDINWKNFSKDGKFSYEKFSKLFFLVTDYKEQPHLATNSIIIVWSVLATTLTIASIAIYFRKDFK